MLFRQMEYFQAVVNTGSFSEAAEVLHISQSAVSQQIKALEEDLGVKLLDRHNRTFSLTPAGEIFHHRSTVILSDIRELEREVRRSGEGKLLRIGYLKCYGGNEFRDAAKEYSEKYPDVELEIVGGNHEDLYERLKSGRVDLVLNDQRRAFSDDYVNYPLASARCMIEISANNPISSLESVETEELKNLTCIIVAGENQRRNEETYHRDILGFRGDFRFAENLQEARILVSTGRGFLPVEGMRDDVYYDSSVRRIPLYKNGEQVSRNYFAFWRKENESSAVRDFAELLKEEFE